MVTWNKLALIERFSDVLFPIQPAELLQALPQLGWIVAKEVFEEGLPPGKETATKKEPATKGDLYLRLNTDNKTLGVEGRKLTPDKVLEGFQALKEFCVENLDPSPEMKTHYTEITGDGWVRAKKDPLKTIQSSWKGSSLIERASKVLGMDATNFGATLVPAGAHPDAANWWHLRIEPQVPSSSTRYHISVVWRNEAPDETFKMMRKLDDTINRLVSEIERG